MSNPPCSDRPEPLVDVVIAAYEAFVAAQNMLDELQAAWFERQCAMTPEENYAYRFGGYQAGCADRAMRGLVEKGVQARDKARDEVIAAVAALAGAKI